MLLAAAPLAAHHSVAAEFDLDKPTQQGTITGFAAKAGIFAGPTGTTRHLLKP